MKRRISFKEEVPVRNNDHNEADAIRLPCRSRCSRHSKNIYLLFYKITVCDGYKTPFSYTRRKFCSISTNLIPKI